MIYGYGIEQSRVVIFSVLAVFIVIVMSVSYFYFDSYEFVGEEKKKYISETQIYTGYFALYSGYFGFFGCNQPPMSFSDLRDSSKIDTYQGVASGLQFGSKIFVVFEGRISNKGKYGYIDKTALRKLNWKNDMEVYELLESRKPTESDCHVEFPE
jgi:hypothetical protein